jgi:Na+-driven multidrug efflux pump
MALVWILREKIYDAYDAPEATRPVMEHAWFVFIIFVFFDCMQAVSSGCISGLALTPRVRFVSIVGYWVLGLPLSCVLVFYAKMSIQGLWFGPTLAVAHNFIRYELAIKQTPWQELVDEKDARLAQMAEVTGQDKDKPDYLPKAGDDEASDQDGKKANTIQ